MQRENPAAVFHTQREGRAVLSLPAGQGCVPSASWLLTHRELLAKMWELAVTEPAVQRQVLCWEMGTLFLATFSSPVVEDET